MTPWKKHLALWRAHIQSPAARHLLERLLETNAFAIKHAKNPPILPQNLLPISNFRESPPEQPWEKIFLSSGTTTSLEGRSKSFFSRDGLTLYQAAACKTFADVLRHHSGEDIETSPTTRRGVSLIPPPTQWPHSSLAHMLGWFSDIWDITFLAAGKHEETALSLTAMKAQPIFLFGTAFHYVHLADQKRPIPLHPQSLIFVTGGTKGQSRSVTDDELLSLISSTFLLPATRIVGEYSMCELASQAYTLTPGDLRSYRFPHWVEVKTIENPTILKDSGAGALVIHDELRLDVGKPLLTEDLAVIGPQGTFQLLGRLPFSTLRGCSLGAESLLADSKTSSKETAPTFTALSNLSTSTPPPLHEMNKIRDTFMLDPGLQHRFTDEFGPHAFTQKIMRQFFAALPSSAADWQKALNTACGGETFSYETLVILAPASHALAVFYPLIFAAVRGVPIKLKVPSFAPKVQNTLQTFVELLQKKLGANVSWIDTAACEQLTQRDFILGFGSDATALTLQEKFAGHSNIYGSAMAWAVLDAQDLLTSETVLDELFYDAFSLCQRGCMSVTATIVLTPAAQTINQKLLQEKITASLEKLPLQDFALSTGERSAAAVRFLSSAHTKIPILGGLTTPAVSFHNAEPVTPIDVLIGKIFPAPLTLPFLWTALAPAELVKHLPRETKTLAVSARLQPFFSQEFSHSTNAPRLCPVGHTQQPPLTGLHEGRPLFLPHP